jgi:hypothetical protein
VNFSSRHFIERKNSLRKYIFVKKILVTELYRCDEEIAFIKRDNRTDLLDDATSRRQEIIDAIEELGIVI